MSSSSEAEAEFDEGEEEEEEEEEYQEEDNAEDEEEEEEEEEDETPRKRRASRSPAVSYAESGDEDGEESSDDDIPLAELAAKMKKKSPAAAAKNGKKKAAAAAPKKKKAAASSSKKRKAAPASASSSGSSASKKKYEWASAALYGSSCDKGKLIQEFLCRWWYSYTWPALDVVNSEPPQHYDRLDGFPGVFVCTEGDDVGTLLDRRDAATAPSFVNMAKKPSSELKALLVSALQSQKQELIKHDGEGTATQKDIDQLMKWANKLNADKADKEAKKVLQASSIKL